VLEPQGSLYAPLRVSAGVGGWKIDEPGPYTVQVVAKLRGEEIVSNPLRLRVNSPRDLEQERLADDFFSDEVARILAFNGSGVLQRGNDVLRKVSERLPQTPVARHARLALGNALARDTKRVEPDDGPGDSRMRNVVDEAEPEEGQRLLESALLDQPQQAVESFGHIRWKREVDRLSDLLAERGQTDQAANAQDVVYDTLSERQVQGSRIIEPVLRDVQRRREGYRSLALRSIRR
jgi:hypothetical protein